MMNAKWTLGWVVAVAFGAAACADETDSKTPGTNATTLNALAVSHAAELPVCDGGAEMSLAFIADENRLVVCRSGKWTDVDLESETPGPQGEKGDEGIQGEQGPKGAQGPGGAKGDMGDQGPKGETGDQGPKGETGDQGPKGEIGDQGPKGETGDKGDQGETGDAGAPGHNSLVEMIVEPIGPHCPGAGGFKIRVGLDTNDDGSLDDEPVVHVGYVCNASRARAAFVTSTFYDGNLDGLAGADKKCQAAADAVPELAGKTFKAWLSSADGTPTSRFSKDGYFVLTDARRSALAYSWADLTDGSLLAPLTFTETGGPLPVSEDDTPPPTAWTNTGADGAALSTTDTCSDWTNSSTPGQAGVGATSSTTATWSDTDAADLCSGTHPLYCFEQ